MSYEKLKEYVEEQKLQKANESNIRLALLEKGWNSDLVEKAILEVFDPKTEEDNSKFISLLKNSWNNFKNNIFEYLTITLISILAPLIPIIIFGAPIAYDVLVFKFTEADFISGPFVPLIFIYASVALIFILAFSFWGKLSIVIASTSKGKILIKSTLKKAWKILGHYVWIQVLTFIIITILAIPSLAILSSLAMKLIPGEFSILFIASAFIFLIPALLGSIMLSFAPYILIVHGARGMNAIKSSYKMIKNNFEFVFTKQLLLFLSFFLISIILSSLLVVGEIAKVFITPILVIFIAKLYFTTEKLYKDQKKDGSEII